MTHFKQPACLLDIRGSYRASGLGLRTGASPMKYDLEGKIFRSASNTDNGEVGRDTVFRYHQAGDIVWAEYEGGDIAKGHLIANVLSTGQLDMRYHHVNRQGQLMIGKCISTPEIIGGGKIKFKEEWQWLSGDMSSGCSAIVEQ
jgi:hypothetical protein